MDLTNCGFDGFFRCGILMDCVRGFTIQAVIPRRLPDSPILQVRAFFHSIKSRDLRAASFFKSGPTAYDGILYSPAVINQLSSQEATISKVKT